jgi:predicted house-cleaning noncanonical NTP pyrophosphatase (MazG superfamily)
MKKGLEEQLREEYNNYQSKSHPEDMMSFIEYIQGIGTFKGYKVQVKESFNLDYKITFKK